MYLFNRLILYFFVNIYLNNYVYSYLTLNQWTSINRILVDQTHTPIQKQQINTVIYKNYEIWAINQALNFKKLHKYKCKSISKSEINLYARMGLYKAIINYNPEKLKNISFALYALIYIRGELYKCITELHPITTVSKYVRRKGKKSMPKFINNETNPTNSFLHIFQEDSFDKYSKQTYIEKHEYRTDKELWEKIDYDMPISHMTKKIIKLKFTYDFLKKRSNKQIAEIVGCSEETVRQQINQFKRQYKSKYIIPFTNK
jgi:RNA polymerase sigma factor (sigma-70 family)